MNVDGDIRPREAIGIVFILCILIFFFAIVN